MSAFRGKAEIARSHCDVRFLHKADTLAGIWLVLPEGV